MSSRCSQGKSSTVAVARVITSIVVVEAATDHVALFLSQQHRYLELVTLSACSPASLAIMAPKDAKTAAKKLLVGKDKETILRVEPYNHYGKHVLRPYVDDGKVLYFPKGVTSEKKFLTTSQVLDRTDSAISELCRRPGFGLSMTSSSIQEMTVFWNANQDDVASALKTLMTHFEGDNAKAFFEACKFMNTRNDVVKSTSAAQTHVTSMFDFYLKNPDELEKQLRKVIFISSRFYVGATSMMESLALVTNRSSGPKDRAKKTTAQSCKVMVG